MKKIILMSVMVMGCNEPEKRLADHDTFSFQYMSAGSSSYHIICDKETGIVYLSRYQGGITKLENRKCTPPRNTR